MTEIQNSNVHSTGFRATFALCVLVSLTASMMAGMNLETVKNCIMIPVSPFQRYGFCEAAGRICALDIVLLWILTLPRPRGMTLLVSSLVFFFRGLVVGNAMRVFFENSVSSLAVTILVSYITVTLLSVIYDAFLNGSGERGPLCRILSCFVATGAAAIIRILPMLLL